MTKPEECNWCWGLELDLSLNHYVDEDLTTDCYICTQCGNIIFENGFCPPIGAQDAEVNISNWTKSQ